VAAMLPAKKQRYASTITAMNPDEKTVTLKDGHKIQYNKLLTTIPLDITLKWLDQPALGARLTYSSTHIIGLGH
jgi:protoporphyrinogen oxidase